MNIKDCPYQINHSWGDPREPDYYDSDSFSVTYKEDELLLFFKVYVVKKDETDEVRCFLQAPRNMRAALSSRWGYREEIFGRILEYLRRIDYSRHKRMQCVQFSPVVLDVSKIDGLFTITLSKVDEKLAPIRYRVPCRPAFFSLLLGSILIFLKHHHYFIGGAERALSYIAICLGLIASFFLIKDMHEKTFVFKMVYMPRLLVSKFNLREKILEQHLKHHGYRYLSTIVWILLLIKFSWVI